jgi:alkaline phosphatase isozyme conversion protein
MPFYPIFAYHEKEILKMSRLFDMIHVSKALRAAGKWACILLCIGVILPVLMSGCENKKTKESIPSDYGSYGTNIALNLATMYPYRSAYSQNEKLAGAFIKSAFEALGYVVEEQVFTSEDGLGESVNYIVRIKGEGLMFPDDLGEYKKETRQVIVGAHYDTFYGTADMELAPQFDGIQDNGSGIGALLTLARELKNQTMGYDVVLVAFGAGDASYMGARSFVSLMTASEIDNTDAMYCIDSIYAGDKLYASSGLNSLVSGQKYEMRRKLYEAYDVVYDNRLSSIKGGVDLLFNQSGILYDINIDGVQDVFREVTMTRSDFTPFDEAGIPIVFFESYDYNFFNIIEFKETKNLELQAFGGMIRHTGLDSSIILQEVLDPEQLTIRINNTAFIIYKAILKGAHNSVTIAQYEAGVTVAPTIHVTASPTPVASITP